MGSKPTSQTMPVISALARSNAKLTILAAVVLFLLTRGYIFFKLEPLVTDVPNSYFQYAASTIDGHRVPYKDFQIEYPPVAWWITYVPRLLDDRRITNPQDPRQVEPILKTYHQTYRAEMFLCDLACFVFLFAIAWQRRPRLAGWTLLTYTITTAFLGHLLDDRLDVPLLLLLLLWAFCWIRSLDLAGYSIAWTAAAYTMLGLSISCKLVPVICIPFLLLSEWQAPRRISRAIVGLLGLAAGVGLPFGIQYAISGPGVFDFLGHHAERGIQIESLYAAIILIGFLFGLPIFIDNSHGAFEVFGDWSPVMKVISSLMLLSFLGGMGLWAILRWSRYRRQDAYCDACYVLIVVVILSNVFSPQYLLWAIPMMLLLAMEVLPEKRANVWILFGLLIVLVALTTWLFPCNYFRDASGPVTSPYGLVPLGSDYAYPSPVACIVLAVRNALYLGIVVWLGAMLFRRSKEGSGTVAPISGGRKSN